MTLHRQHLALVNTTAVDGITDVSWSDGLGTTRPMSDGIADPRFVAVNSHMPRCTITTEAINTALAAVGFDGTATSFTIYDKKLGTGGAAAASTAHVKYLITTALILPRSFSVSGQGNATVSLEAIGYATSGSPVTISQSQALPSDAIGADEVFGIGPVVVNGTAITGIQSVTIDFGINEVMDQADGLLTARDVRIIGRMPTITVTTNDPVMRTTVTAQGLAITTATLGFRKRSEGGTYVADNETSHFLVTINEGIALPASTSGDPRLFTFTIQPTYDGTNASVVLGTGVALS